MTDATGAGPAHRDGGGLPRGGRGHPVRPPLATGYHQPAVAPRTPAARHPTIPPNALACRIGPAHPGRDRDGTPLSRAGREPGCGGPAGTGVD